MPLNYSNNHSVIKFKRDNFLRFKNSNSQTNTANFLTPIEIRNNQKYLRSVPLSIARSYRCLSKGKNFWPIGGWHKSFREYWWCRRCASSQLLAPSCTSLEAAHPFPLDRICLGTSYKAPQGSSLCGCTWSHLDRKNQDSLLHRTE